MKRTDEQLLEMLLFHTIWGREEQIWRYMKILENLADDSEYEVYCDDLEEYQLP